jgi:hypothetical protein
MRRLKSFTVLALALAAGGCVNQRGAIGPISFDKTNADRESFNTAFFGPPPPNMPGSVRVVEGSDEKPDFNFTEKYIVELGRQTPDAPAYVQYQYNNIYRLCNIYFDSLILVQNETGYLGDTVSVTGTAAGTILGLAKASSAAIGMVAAGFGWGYSMTQNYNNRALMTPYPSETKTLVMKALDDYQNTYPAKGTETKLEAISKVQHYAENCTYSGITRLSKAALAQAKPQLTATATPAAPATPATPPKSEEQAKPPEPKTPVPRSPTGAETMGVAPSL